MHKKLHVSALALLVFATEAYAQATSPASPAGSAAPGGMTAIPPATEDGTGMGWLLPLIALLVVGGLLWYFLKGRNRTATTASTGSVGTPMNRTGGSTSAPGSTTPGEPTIKVYDNKKS